MCCGNNVPLLRKYNELIVTDDIVEFKFSVSRACTLKPCESYYWNVVSKIYLKNVVGFNEEEVTDFLSKKGQKIAAKARQPGAYSYYSYNNPFSKEYWTHRGYSEIEASTIMKNKADKSIQTKKENGYFDIKSNNPFSKEYWTSKGYAANTAQYKVNSRNWVCKEFANYEIPEYIRGKTISIDYGVYKGLSLDDAVDRYETICKHRKENSTTHLILRYGNNFTSREAMRYFIALYKLLRKKYKLDRYEIYFAANKTGEYFVRNTDLSIIQQKIFFYDFVVPKLKLCIEYNGTHVHPKLNLSEESANLWKHAYNKQDYYTCLQKDLYKIKLIEDKGFSVLSVWSDETDMLNKMINFLETKL